ncbi:MAG TPA: hypothetical protein VMG60_09195 [Burkholderiaceae bacterium]|nr:hypothetical protein [Burkholderiaceae bacterium]
MNTIIGTATLRPTPPRPRSADAAALAGAWFEAAAPGGPLRLYASGTARHAADAAVALARCEPLLDALDDWSGTALDWRWIAAPAAVTSAASHARAHWTPETNPTGKREVGCRLELPWALLRSLPAPDQTLARQLHWADVPVTLAVARLWIEPDELGLLERGGAVVLPESMQAGWQGVLRALDEPATPGHGVPVTLASPWAPRRVRVAPPAPARAAAVGAGTACEVRLAIPHAVASDRLSGWFEGDVGAVGVRAGLWRCASEREPAVCLAAGELMPWGDGWALAIEDLYEIRHARR